MKNKKKNSACRKVQDAARHQESVSDVADEMIRFADDASKSKQTIPPSALVSFATRISSAEKKSIAFKRTLVGLLRRIRERLDASDASISVIAGFIESEIRKPLSQDDLTDFRDFLDALDNYVN